MKNPSRHKRKPRRSPGGTVIAAPSTRARIFRLPRRAPAPDWKTITTALAGGAGAATAAGLVVNQNLLRPETVGLGLMAGGSAAAYYTDGLTRIAGFGAAAAGAGMLALSLFQKQVAKRARTLAPPNANAQRAPAAPAGQPAAPAGQPAAPAAPPPPPTAGPPRQSATSEGVVLDMFRDAATDPYPMDDEWRYGMHDYHDSPRDAAEPYVIDLDEAA